MELLSYLKSFLMKNASNSRTASSSYTLKKLRHERQKWKLDNVGKIKKEELLSITFLVMLTIKLLLQFWTD